METDDGVHGRNRCFIKNNYAQMQENESERETRYSVVIELLSAEGGKNG
jgi:hypothetical protein